MLCNKDRHNWEPYLPRMVELYKLGKSIPDIHKTLKSDDNSFSISEKQLYNKFNSLHLPTKKNGDRESTIQALKQGRWESSIDGVDAFGNLVVPGPLWETQDVYPRSFNTQSSITGKALPLRTSPPRNEYTNTPSFGSSLGTNSWENDNHLNHSQAHLDTKSDISHDLPSQTYGPRFINREYDGSLGDNSHSNSTFFDDSNNDAEPLAAGPLENDTYISPPQWQLHSQVDNVDQQMANYSNGYKRQISGGGSVSASERQRIAPPLSIVASIPEELVLGCDGSTRQPPAKKCFKTHTQEFIERKHAAQMRIIRSTTPDKRLSTSTSGSWRDSGYVSSGRTTPMTLLLEEATLHKDSLLEFGGLYRMPCQLHEQQGKDRFKEAKPCLDCHMSGIHHIGWSARYYTLEVFRACLTSRPDIGDIDGSGNSALHYAAAGGASLAHFSALIDAGVNPYQLNTAGQLFLNCLTPSAGFTSVDPQSLELFSMNLVYLLNLFQANGGFRWRDNDGNTIKFDILLGQVYDQPLRDKIFSDVKDAGYPFLFSHGTSASATNNTNTSQQRQPVANSADLFWLSHERQQKAWEVLAHASDDPSYVDPSTGNNALLALALVKLGGKGSLLPKIRQYINAGVDLNHFNHAKEPALVAMIRERPWQGIDQEETGPALSMYLDALLWKDPEKKVRNMINVDLKNREGATALYYVSILARPDSVRSLIEAGANVNACLDVNGCHVSILQATRRARANSYETSNEKWKLKLHAYDTVISYLELNNAVDNPSRAEERALSHLSMRTMPI